MSSEAAQQQQHRVTTPTGLSGLGDGDPMSYEVVISDSSPVPALCSHSDAGSASALSHSNNSASAPDLVISRSLSEPGAFDVSGGGGGGGGVGLGMAQQASSSWHHSSLLLDPAPSSTVPRVVSTLLPPPTSSSTSTSPVDPAFEALFGGSGAAAAGHAAATSTAAAKPAAARRRHTPAKAKGGDSAAAAGVGGDPAIQRRQKRLERNRESARLSRRRRKQYLEILEGRVTEYSQEMDRGRRAHVARAVTTVQDKRRQQLLLLPPSSSEGGTPAATPDLPLEEGDLMGRLRQLQTNLSRTSPELMVATTFRSQQLKSFALPPESKFIVWLTLQSDAYFRGGRAASERLSAARIGERILNSGTDRVTPAQSMWPLLCSEIGLSYEQEEKVRTFQRTLLQNPDTWVDRHATHASAKALEAAHDALQAVTLRLGQRERSTLGILTPQQQFKFLTWADKHRQRLPPPSTPSSDGAAAPTFGDPKYQTSDSHHPAANLYILHHRLQSILQKIPRAAPLVTGATLKKLARRPSFESLGCVDKDDEPLSRDRSFSSAGSLKRSASEITMDAASASGACGSGLDDKSHVPPISPPEAQEAAAPTVRRVLGHVQDIIPPPPTVSVTLPLDVPLPAPTPIGSMVAPPAPHPSMGAPASLQTGALLQGSVSAPALAAAQQQHQRKPSFLPPHLNLVPEELWGADDGSGMAAEDFLMNLVDEDWAIGEGIDMELDAPA